MGLFVEQNSNRSKLQEKLAAELQEKARRNSNPEGSPDGGSLGAAPDGVNDSAYMKDTKQTTSLAWVWAILALIGVGVVIWLVIVALNR